MWWLTLLPFQMTSHRNKMSLSRSIFIIFKVLMDETKSEGSFSDRTLPRVKLFTRWNRPAWPWFNFSWNIRVSTSFCVQLWLHSGTILWTDVRDFIYEWCNFVAYASNLLTLIIISGYGLFNHYWQKWEGLCLDYTLTPKLILVH